jgi:hypothetical protein
LGRNRTPCARPTQGRLTHPFSAVMQATCKRCCMRAWRQIAHTITAQSFRRGQARLDAHQLCWPVRHCGRLGPGCGDVPGVYPGYSDSVPSRSHRAGVPPPPDTRLTDTVVLLRVGCPKLALGDLFCSDHPGKWQLVRDVHPTKYVTWTQVDSSNEFCCRRRPAVCAVPQVVVLGMVAEQCSQCRCCSTDQLQAVS